ncbi:MAG: hypothetical protein QM767_18975 [Anaeromyxobacter sp.]
MARILRDLMAFAREHGPGGGPADLTEVLEQVSRLVGPENPRPGPLHRAPAAGAAAGAGRRRGAGAGAGAAAARGRGRHPGR